MTDTADALGPEAAPLGEAAENLADASSNTEASADWSAYAEHSMDTADAYRGESAFYVEEAQREAEMGWTSSAEYDLRRAQASSEMAGEYDAQATSGLGMSEEYLSDAGVSTETAVAQVESYDASAAADTSSYDTGSTDAGDAVAE